MKKYYVLCMLSCLLITGNVAGQQADPFYVGTYGFTPEWDANLHKTHFVRGVTGTPSNDWERIHYLSQVQFDRARELGMNLVYPAVYPRNVADTTPGVIEQIHDAAIADHNNPLYMSVLEFTLGDYLHGERIMLHPESGNDFDQQGSYLQTQDEQFIDFPVQGARLATPLREHKAQINSIQMEHGFGVISGVNMKRKLELSMYRNYRDTSSNREGEEGSGLYIVSATVLINDPAELTNDSLPLMEVTIHTVDSSTSTPASLSFMLYESDFFDQNDQPIDVPVELILGYIEIRQDSGVVFIRERDVNNNAWLDTGLRKYAKVISNDEYHNKDSTSEKLGPIDLEISYAGDANSPAFQLDAVCLSSPRTFAMFHPDHPVVQPGGALEA
ncbi:MAG: hypothetical protein KFH87_05555, partial [Bacteroidetes bacterium]|nr:hypothetical protein [Bacteroidota bacterium]